MIRSMGFEAFMEAVTGIAGFMIIGFRVDWWIAIAVFLILWSLYIHIASLIVLAKHL